MSRPAYLIVALSIALSACSPIFSPISSGDSQATAIALAGTQGAQTVAAQPTPTLLPSETLAPTTPPTATATKTKSPTSTASPTVPDGAGTATGTIPASTPTAATPTPTFGFGTITPTDLMIPRAYGTQPPLVIYGTVHLINMAKVQVYISFQCRTPDEQFVVAEFPVESVMTVSVSAGQCHYVAWVGGRQFIGDIKINKFEEYTFKFKKDSIIIQP